MSLKIRIVVPTLGDFCNGFPVYDAFAKKYGTFQMILPQAMTMFVGIKDFVSYQGFTNSVSFENEVTDVSNMLPMLELDAPNFQTIFGNRDPSITRPFFTCHQEMFLKYHLKVDFDIDDNYRLKVKDIPINVGDLIWAGDRWSKTLDHRRAHSMLGHIPGLKFLDFKKSIFYNLNIIQKCKYPFVSTFTGVSILADLIGKENIVVWDDTMNGFMGWSPEFSFRKHYFTDRKSKLIYINDFKTNDLEMISNG